MPTLDGPAVYRYALAAFSRAGITGAEARVKAATATGISYAESGWQTNGTPGDINLQGRKWGPSIGLWQIRSLNSELGSGGTRDETANRDPAHNADSMVAISSGGTNWIPWTVWKRPELRVGVQQVAAQVATQVGMPFDEIGQAAGGTRAAYGIGDIANAINHPADTASAAASILAATASGAASLVTGPVDALAATASGAASLVTGPVDALAAIGHVFSRLGDPTWWRRVGMGSLGVTLAAAGIYVAVGDLKKAATNA